MQSIGVARRKEMAGALERRPKCKPVGSSAACRIRLRWRQDLPTPPGFPFRFHLDSPVTNTNHANPTLTSRLHSTRYRLPLQSYTSAPRWLTFFFGCYSLKHMSQSTLDPESRTTRKRFYLSLSSTSLPPSISFFFLYFIF